MFTGIIQAVGVVAAVEGTRGRRVAIDWGPWDGASVMLGDSIAVQGVCLTVAGQRPAGFWADVSEETLARTTLAGLAPRRSVNLEPALRLQDRLGGHLVSGHVDAVGALLGRRAAGNSERLEFSFPDALTRYVALKGSICIDGVSLTVNEVQAGTLAVNLVPHTLAVTTLGSLRPGDAVNLEVDLIARYLEALLRGADAPAAGTVTRGFLAEHGFLTGADRNRV